MPAYRSRIAEHGGRLNAWRIACINSSPGILRPSGLRSGPSAGGQGDARANRLAVHQQRAGPANAVLAADMRAGQQTLIANEIGQRQPVVDGARHRLPLMRMLIVFMPRCPEGRARRSHDASSSRRSIASASQIRIDRASARRPRLSPCVRRSSSESRDSNTGGSARRPSTTRAYTTLRIDHRDRHGLRQNRQASWRTSRDPSGRRRTGAEPGRG